MVNVRLVEPFKGSVAAPNDFVIVGGVMTVRLALEVDRGPAPAAVELMVTLLLKTPSVADLTARVIVQLPAGKDAFVNVTLAEPATAVNVPPQLVVTPGVAATTKFVGNVSVKLASLATAFGFVTLNVSVLDAFTATVVGLKLLTICNGSRITMFAVIVA